MRALTYRSREEPLYFSRTQAEAL
jgi:hypothetical protein